MPLNEQASAAEFEAAKTMEPEQLISILLDALKATAPSVKAKDPTLMLVLEYVATTVSGMIAGLFFDEKDWSLQGAHFTCFTRTKVQILTPEEVLSRLPLSRAFPLAHRIPGAHLTCFTSTNVQRLTPEELRARRFAN